MNFYLNRFLNQFQINFKSNQFQIKHSWWKWWYSSCSYCSTKEHHRCFGLLLSLCVQLWAWYFVFGWRRLFVAQSIRLFAWFVGALHVGLHIPLLCTLSHFARLVCIARLSLESSHSFANCNRWSLRIGIRRIHDYDSRLVIIYLFTIYYIWSKKKKLIRIWII